MKFIPNNNYKNITWFTLDRIYPILVLIIIATITYWSYYAPVLYGDDWSIIVGRWYFNTLTQISWRIARPLLNIPYIILYQIFGLNIHAFYAVLWLLNLFAAILFYFLILRFVSTKKLIALTISALALVYPADFTHMWLTMIVIRLTVVLTLLYMHLLLTYANTGNKSALGGALICLALPLGFYEGQLGIVMAWSFFVILMKFKYPWSRLLGVALPIIVGFIFALWRTVGYVALGINKNDLGHLDDLQLSPIIILSNLIRGFQVMVWAWIEPLVHAFGFSSVQALLILVLMVVLFCSPIYLLGYRKFVGAELTEYEYLAQLRQSMIMVFIGAMFIVAGYVPVIARSRPTFFPLHSRVNLFALHGAAITMVSLLILISLLLNKKRPQSNLVALVGMIPLIILGMLVQRQVQFDNRQAWEQQKQIWNELFVLAPDLKDNTRIYFVLPDDNQTASLNLNGQRPPLRASWEIGAALNILYGKKGLGGDVVDKSLLGEDGIRNRWDNEITPYNQTVFMVYEGNLKGLRIIENLQAEGLVNFPIPEYDPYTHISDIQTPNTGLRMLVTQGGIARNEANNKEVQK